MWFDVDKKIREGVRRNLRYINRKKKSPKTRDQSGGWPLENPPDRIFKVADVIVMFQSERGVAYSAGRSSGIIHTAPISTCYKDAYIIPP